jgi:putative oxidoreductase
VLKRFFFGSSIATTGMGEVSLFALRVYAGLAMLMAHGLGKVPPSERFIGVVGEMGFPMPTLFAWSAGLAESVGGALLALGLLTRPAAFSLAFTMGVAALVRHAEDPFTKQELPLLYFFVYILFMMVGSGRIGLDRFFRK